MFVGLFIYLRETFMAPLVGLAMSRERQTRCSRRRLLIVKFISTATAIDFISPSLDSPSI